MTLKKEEKKEDIFRAALGLFSRHGFRKTTIEEVARSTGMTKGNLYFYVRDKKDLYHQTIDWALTQWQDSVSRAVEKASPPKEKFAVMARAALGYIEASRELQDLLITDPDIFTLDRRKDRFPKTNQAALAIIKEILDLGTAGGEFAVKDTDATARYLFSLYMMFLIQNYVYMEQKDFRKIFEAALEVNLKGLLPTP